MLMKGRWATRIVVKRWLIPTGVLRKSLSIPPQYFHIRENHTEKHAKEFFEVTQMYEQLRELRGWQSNSLQEALVTKLDQLRYDLIRCHKGGVQESRLNTAFYDLRLQWTENGGKPAGFFVSSLLKNSPSFLTMVKNIVGHALPNAFRGVSMREKEKKTWLESRTSEEEPSRGLTLCDNVFPDYPSLRCFYIWGGVGQGKTMMMDILFNSLPFSHKIRYHFYSFMLHVHKMLHTLRHKGLTEDVVGTQNDTERERLRTLLNVDPVLSVAYLIALRHKVLCLDEFQVIHIADAMILKRLLQGLWHFGCVVIVTSNRAPEELYKGGLNRDRFLPFIEFIQKSWAVFHMSTAQDFRQQKILALDQHTVKGGSLLRFRFPSRSVKEVINELAIVENRDVNEGAPGEIVVGEGRSLLIPFRLGKSCCFSFEDLCKSTIGASDYIALAKHSSILFLHSIPSLRHFYEQQNEIRRFIQFIDVFYEHNIVVFFDSFSPVLKIFGPTQVTLSFDALIKSIRQGFGDDLRSFYEQLRSSAHGLGEPSLEGFFRLVVSLCPELSRCGNTLLDVLKSARWDDGVKMKDNPEDFVRMLRWATFQYILLGCEDVTGWKVRVLEEEEKAMRGQPGVLFDFTNIANGEKDTLNIMDNHFASSRCISRIRFMLSKEYGQAIKPSTVEQ